MTKRLISFILVIVMLLGVMISTASCVALEEFIGYENLSDEYLDKYYPDREQTGDNTNNGNNGGNTGDSGNNGGNTGNNGGNTGNNGDSGNNGDPGNSGGNTDEPVGIPNEHASYAEHKDGYNLITFY